MNFVGPKLLITASQINLATNSVNITTSLPGGRSSYEASQNVMPASVERHDPYDLPIGLEPANLYYLKPTGSNYKIYSNISDAIAGTNAFVFTNTSYFDFVFPKSRRTLSTFSIAEDVGEMYCCETPTPLNSTVLYDRCTVVWEGDSYTLKRIPKLGPSLTFIAFNAFTSFVFISDPFLKDDMWHIISIGAEYKTYVVGTTTNFDHDFMNLELNITVMSTTSYVIGTGGFTDSTEAECVGGAVTSVTVRGHLSTVFEPWAMPRITITSATGTGATAVVNVPVGSEAMTATVTNGGSGYTQATATIFSNGERRFELINPATSTRHWPTNSFPYGGTLTDADTVRNLPSVSYSFSGLSVMPPATVVLKGAYFAGTKATPFPTALELPNCVAVATSTITLSGLQTIGGVPLQAGDRVLVTGNNSYPDYGKSNGIYLASAGVWSRAGDTFVSGSYTFVNQGTGGKKRYWITSTGFYGVTFPIVYGTTVISFNLYTTADLPITYDNVDLGNITETCTFDAETNTYYSAVMTLNGIPGRINFGVLGLPPTSLAKFLLESGAVGTGLNMNLSNDDFNGLTGVGLGNIFDTVLDPVPTIPPRFFTGLLQSKPFFDTRLTSNGSTTDPVYKMFLRTVDTSRTGAIMTLQFSRAGRAVKSIGLPSETFTIKAYYGDSYISTL